MGHYKINKPLHGSEEWLAVRWSDEEGLPRISASVAAAVHGEHPFTTPADLAIELLASEPPMPKEPNSAMIRGTKLEPVIIEWAAQVEGLELEQPDIMYCFSEDGVRLIATLDAIQGDTPYEVKTTNKRWSGVLPRYWYWQGVQQAICADSKSIEWIIFDSDLQLHRYTQNVTSDERQIHVEACRSFLESIDAGVMPPNAEYLYRHAQEQFPESEAKSQELTVDGWDALVQLLEVQDQLKVLQEQEDKLKAIVCQELGDAEVGTIGKETVCTWKSATRNSFDSKKFELDHPALAKKYKKQSSYRTFRISKGAK